MKKNRVLIEQKTTVKIVRWQERVSLASACIGFVMTISLALYVWFKMDVNIVFKIIVANVCIDALFANIEKIELAQARLYLAGLVEDKMREELKKGGE
jgi:hypothetical protein